ncbi:MAG TPA: cytochrome P450 [Bryobacteraceae bacterium]|nr:cytochrome P450 [Bryobacteraceae bacterium]
MSLFTEETRRDPYPIYKALRSIGPVVQDERSRLWLLLDYEDCKRALNDPAIFSSNLGEYAAQPTPPWMIFTDPPRHTELRTLVARTFTRAALAGLETRIGEICRQLLDQGLQEDGTIDFASAFAVPLPICVIAEIIGVPTPEWPLFRRWTDDILALSETLHGSQADKTILARYGRAHAEMTLYLHELTSVRRRAGAADGLLAGLLEARVTGSELVSFLELLLTAGSETTTNLLNNAVLCFIEHGHQFARLRSKPALMPAALEEVLRYRSPLQFVFRATRQQVTIANRSVPKGALVLVVVGAANRDPAVFDNPEQFDIGRDPNPHIAFGHGVHFCLGAALARMEARIAFSEFFNRVSCFDLAANGPLKSRSALNVLGPESLPLRYTTNHSHALEMEAYA